MGSNAQRPAPDRPFASARSLSRECMIDAHELCPGTVEVKPRNAPYWEEPDAVVPCGCTECNHQTQEGTR